LKQQINSIIKTTMNSSSSTTTTPPIVYPGQNLTNNNFITTTTTNNNVIIGGGIQQIQSTLTSTIAGPFRQDGERIWISESRKRYLPQIGDVVIGIVTDVLGETYQVDIGGPRLATLDSLAFDGASKRNAPDLIIGALVFAQVIRAGGDIEPQISCQSLGIGVKKDWATGESTFGELGDERGCMFEIPRATCKRLSSPTCALLDALASWFAYEIVVGLNGRVWIAAEDARHVIVIGNVLQAASGLNINEGNALSLVKKFAKVAKISDKSTSKISNNNNNKNNIEDEDNKMSDVEMLLGED
jgi:exosome complex component RRP40